jgi:hypothetical protein
MPGSLIPGEEARRLFDIVGLDEGTCGRRPGLWRPLGVGRSVKFMPFLNADPAQACLAGRANVLIRKHTSLYICAGTAPGDAGLVLVIPPRPGRTST